MEERFEAFLRVEDRGSHVTWDRKVLEYNWFPVDNQERNVLFSGHRFYPQMRVLIFYSLTDMEIFISLYREKGGFDLQY